ncbi:hypothetical protein BDD12DRAFT_525420 [Trichophaea hybrida]|nr:hypothetical protein BDD12DRAFT_525420 [Trichophaea hybrida]
MCGRHCTVLGTCVVLSVLLSRTIGSRAIEYKEPGISSPVKPSRTAISVSRGPRPINFDNLASQPNSSSPMHVRRLPICSTHLEYTIKPKSLA